MAIRSALDDVGLPLSYCMFACLHLCDTESREFKSWCIPIRVPHAFLIRDWRALKWDARVNDARKHTIYLLCNSCEFILYVFVYVCMIRNAVGNTSALAPR